VFDLFIYHISISHLSDGRLSVAALRLICKVSISFEKWLGFTWVETVCKLLLKLVIKMDFGSHNWFFFSLKFKIY